METWGGLRIRSEWASVVGLVNGEMGDEDIKSVRVKQHQKGVDGDAEDDETKEGKGRRVQHEELCLYGMSGLYGKTREWG